MMSPATPFAGRGVSHSTVRSARVATHRIFASSMGCEGAGLPGSSPSPTGAAGLPRSVHASTALAAATSSAGAARFTGNRGALIVGSNGNRDGDAVKGSARGSALRTHGGHGFVGRLFG